MSERTSAVERVLGAENYRDLFFGFVGAIIAEAIGALPALALLRVATGPVDWRHLPLAYKAAVALWGPLAYGVVALARYRRRVYLLAGIGAFLLLSYADLALLLLRR